MEHITCCLSCFWSKSRVNNSGRRRFKSIQFSVGTRRTAKPCLKHRCAASRAQASLNSSFPFHSLSRHCISTRMQDASTGMLVNNSTYRLKETLEQRERVIPILFRYSRRDNFLYCFLFVSVKPRQLYTFKPIAQAHRS